MSRRGKAVLHPVATPQHFTFSSSRGRMEMDKARQPPHTSSTLFNEQLRRQNVKRLLVHWGEGRGDPVRKAQMCISGNNPSDLMPT
jgi:hypothetical protein